MGQRFLPPEKIIEESAALILKEIEKSILERGRCLLGFSGGKSPSALYEAVAKKLQIPSISNLVICLVDERAVPLDHAESNYRLLQEHFVSQLPLTSERPQLIFPDTSLPLKDAAARYDQQLKTLLRESGGLDLCLLGIGDDGHTASLFPGMEKYYPPEESETCAFSLPDSPTGRARISMSYRMILKSKKIFFYVPGESKKQILDRVLAKDAPLFCASQYIIRNHPDVLVIRS